MKKLDEYIFNVVRNLAKKIIDKKNINYRILERQYFYRKPSKEEFLSLKNKYKGERCFIVGNGPSLNKNNLSLLKKEKSFAVNGIFYKTDEMGYKPNFYVVEDFHVMHDNLQKIRNYDVEYKFFPTNYKHLVDKNINTLFFNMNTGYYQEDSPNFSMPRFSADCSKEIFCGHSVTIINLQLAYYLGFKEVYLIGMDFNYDIPKSASIEDGVIVSNADDDNHFHPEYFGKGKKWHDPQLPKVLNSYKLAKIIYESDGRKIYNATVGGKLELFDRVDYNSLF